MKLRYFVGGVTGLAITGMAFGLMGVGIDNIQKSKLLDAKRQELNISTGTVPPPESSRLSPQGPAYPSPGYEN